MTLPDIAETKPIRETVAELMTRYEALPQSVQDIVRDKFLVEYREIFEEAHDELMDSFLADPDIHRQWLEFVDRAWDEAVRDCDDHTGLISCSVPCELNILSSS